MSKRILSVILALCMLIGIISVTAFAENDYKYSKIAYFKDSVEVLGLTAGNITAKIKVKSDSKTDTLFFATFLYKNNKLIDASIDESPSAVASTAVQYDATIAVPSDLTGVKLVSVLWEDVKGMKPVCASSIVPSNEITLTELTVDGTPLEGFDPSVYEYEVELTEEQAKRASAPWIGYKAFDNGVKVEVTDPVKFPGASIITVTGSDGESTATYTINYTVDYAATKLIEIVSYTYSKDEKPLSISTLKAGMQLMSNREQSYQWVSPLIEGLGYINFGANQTSTTVKVNFPGNLSAYATPGFNTNKVDAGWSLEETGWDIGEENNWANPDGTYWVLDNDGNQTDVSRIGNGLDEFPSTCFSGANVNESEWGGTYDVREQGWFYLNYRETQKYRPHKFGCMSIRATKHLAAEEQITVGTGGSGLGSPITYERDPWTPAVNPDADLAL